MTTHGIFEAFKAALWVDDIDKALSFIVDTSLEWYTDTLTQLRPYFQDMVNDMGQMILISQDEYTTVYDLLREEDGETYGYPVFFARDEYGNWAISDF